MGSNKIKKKINYRVLFFRLFLCLAGSFLLAFGTGVFLTPAKVVAGGISGVGIIISYYVGYNVVDVIVWIFNILFFILSFIFLGRKFTLHTLIATFAFPIFLTIFQRTECFEFISKIFVDDKNNLLLAGIFGGLFVGAGVAVTFLGDGSTGGTDVLCFIVAKYTPIKQGVTSFICDALIIVIGMICLHDNMPHSLVGILSAFITALMIEVIFVQSNNIYIADIVTKKYRELSTFVINELDGTCTIIDAKGAYKNDKDVKMVRLVVDRREFITIKDQISKIDEEAFVTVTTAKKVLGEGFSALYKKREKFVKKK